MASERPERRLSCWITLTILVCLLGLTFIALTAGYRWYIIRGMTPARRAFLERMRTDRIPLPARWATENPKDFAKVDEANMEFDRLMSAYASLWQREEHTSSPISDALRALQSGVPVEEDQWTRISILATALAPTLEQTSEAVALKDYALNEKEMFDVGADDGGRFESFTKGAALTAHLRARDGDWNAAFEPSLLAIKSAAHFEEANTNTPVFAGTILQFQMPTLNRMANDCPDAAPIVHALDALNEWRPRVLPTEDELTGIRTIMHMLTMMRRSGYISELPDNQPCEQYARMFISLTPGYIDYMLKRLPVGHPAMSSFLQAAKDVSGARWRWPRPLLRVDIMLSLYSTSDSGIARRNFLCAHYDLLRLKLAQRIAELRGEPPITRAKNAVPKYLPTEPLDPYTSAPFHYHAPANRFYSIGPDHRDDGTSVPYGPVLKPIGAVGDIWLGD